MKDVRVIIAKCLYYDNCYFYFAVPWQTGDDAEAGGADDGQEIDEEPEAGGDKKRKRKKTRRGAEEEENSYADDVDFEVHITLALTLVTVIIIGDMC